MLSSSRSTPSACGARRSTSSRSRSSSWWSWGRRSSKAPRPAPRPGNIRAHDEPRALDVALVGAGDDGRAPGGAGADRLREQVAAVAAAATSADIVSENPADPADRIGTFQPGGGIDVDRAVSAARDAATGYAALPAQARADALDRAAARVEAR